MSEMVTGDLLFLKFTGPVGGGWRPALRVAVLRSCFKELTNYLPPSMDLKNPNRLKNTTFSVCGVWWGGGWVGGGRERGVAVKKNLAFELENRLKKREISKPLKPIYLWCHRY